MQQWKKRLASMLIAGIMAVSALTGSALAVSQGIGGYDQNHTPSYGTDFVLTQSTTYDQKTNEVQSYTEYWSNADGQIVKAIDYAGGAETGWSIYSYRNGSLAQISEYSGQTLKQTNAYTRNENGTIKSEVVTVHDNGSMNMYTYTYTYDAHNQISQKVLYATANGQTEQITEVYANEYNDAGQLTKMSVYQSLNGTNTLLYWQTYDYDAQGRRIQSVYHENKDLEGNDQSFVDQRFSYSADGREDCYDRINSAQGDGSYTLYAYDSRSTYEPYTLACYEVFTDINMNDWHVDYVRYVYENGLMTGTSVATFGPDQTITRAQVAQILYAKAGKPDTAAQTPFGDISADAWYYKAVCWAYENGVAAGTSGTTFSPNQEITREELAVMLYAAVQRPSVTGAIDGFADTGAVSSWSYAAMLWATQNGIISGIRTDSGLQLNPQGAATRAQAATMLCAFIEKV